MLDKIKVQAEVRARLAAVQAHANTGAMNAVLDLLDAVADELTLEAMQGDADKVELYRAGYQQVKALSDAIKHPPHSKFGKEPTCRY